MVEDSAPTKIPLESLPKGVRKAENTRCDRSTTERVVKRNPYFGWFESIDNQILRKIAFFGDRRRQLFRFANDYAYFFADERIGIDYMCSYTAVATDDSLHCLRCMECEAVAAAVRDELDNAVLGLEKEQDNILSGLLSFADRSKHMRFVHISGADTFMYSANHFLPSCAPPLDETTPISRISAKAGTLGDNDVDSSTPLCGLKYMFRASAAVTVSNELLSSVRRFTIASWQKLMMLQVNMTLCKQL
uniref:Uncharacterized protein n=1 Tax=Parascaris equorum TaxID=6256 RepID=A0A914S6V2_PAREQ